MRKAIAVLAGVVLCLLVGLWRASSGAGGDEPAVVRDASTEISHVARAAAAPGMMGPLVPRHGTGTKPPPPVLDSLDPCQPVDEPDPPDGFETKQISNNITIAWHVDADVKLHASTIGRVAQGIAEEAAEATGTTPRDHLLIVIYGSTAEFHEQTHAPPWSGGLYDGAIRIPFASQRELGVTMRSIRHEIMHAQLHAAVGCMPTWFDEGIATYFAGDPDIHDLLGLVRDGGLYDPDSLSVTGISDMNAREPSRVYAQAVAMVMYAIEHHGDLRTMVAAYRAAPDVRRAEIWKHWFPEGHTAELVDFVGRHLFGQSPGPALDAVLHATVCCSGTTSYDTLACRAPTTPHAERTYWTERSRGPIATCSSRY